MSPTPGRSTLITSAPNQASNCVQVGPDWTWVKSRMRTPSSAFVIVFAPYSRPRIRRAYWGLKVCLLLLQNALRIEVADAAAFGAGGGIDHRVDQGRLAGIHRLVDGALQFVRRRRVDACAAERFHHPVVARALDEHGRRGIGAGRIDVGAAVDSVIVEDHDADRQLVAADRLDLHAGKAERRVAFDRENRLAGLYCRRDGIAHADADNTPGADVEPLARLVHVDDAAGEIERVGA